MKRGRLNIQTAGWWVLQDHDVQDPFATAYTDLNRPINYAARYGITTDSDGFPAFGPVAGTRGPIGGALCLPGIGGGGRNMAQWAFGCVPAKITTSGIALKATPVNTGDGTGWTPATDLAEVVCYTSDGSMPSVGTFGLLVLGTELGDQNPLFFAGSSGTGLKTYKVTLNSTGGPTSSRSTTTRVGLRSAPPVSRAARS
jgi:hypothetical protein